VGLLAILALIVTTTMGTPSPSATRSAAALTPASGPAEEARPPIVSPRETAGDTVSFASTDAKREAFAAYSTGDYVTSLAQLESAVAGSPHDAEARNNLGQLLVRLGRALDALPHFDEAVRLDGQRWAYRFNRARAYGLLDGWTEAIADYRVAATLFPEDHATLYNLGLALLRVRDYPGAIATLEQAVAAAPEEHGFLITLGTAYVRAEQPDRARATFERFLAAAATDADAPRVKAVLEALAAAGQ
jgi:tetratricopeptide (TPR) repeat protein